MQETKEVHLFDINPIILDIEKVIQQGLNKLLVNYIERHELLEKTHQQLMLLPSIAEELNRRKNNSFFNESEDNTKNYNISNLTSIKDMTENIVQQHVVSLENKLNKIEKKHDVIIDILDKLVGKITYLNSDVKEIQKQRENINNNKYTEELVYSDTIEKSSIVKTSENENIEIHIQEPTQEVQEEISDDEEINSALITCTVIKLNSDIEEKNNKDIEEESTHSEKTFVLEEKKEDEAEIEKENNEDEYEAEIEKEDNEHEEEVEEEDNEDKESKDKESKDEDDDDDDEAEEEVEEEVEEDNEDKESKDEDEDEELEQADEQEQDELEEVEESSVEPKTKEVDEASVETEIKENEESEDDEEIYEIDIDDTTYCTNNDENGFIWELTKDSEQGEKVGYFKNGEPFFYAEEN
jgi:hypothetical protein